MGMIYLDYAFVDESKGCEVPVGTSIFGQMKMTLWILYRKHGEGKWLAI